MTEGELECLLAGLMAGGLLGWRFGRWEGIRLGRLLGRVEMNAVFRSRK